MHSGIYTGWVRHRRYTPTQHQLRYQIYMMYLDLSEIDEVLNLSPWWSRKPWRPARFERSDFLGDPALSLDSAVRERIYNETGEAHTGPIRMLANLRYLGFNMNPITSYYCFDKHERLQTIVADVHNTPWNERTSYVLACDPNKRQQRIFFTKQMHVSPFNPLGMSYHWRSNTPGSRLSLHLEACRDGDSTKTLDATMVMERSDITASSLNRILVRYPMMTIKVITAIYWEALKLWLKKTPVHDHPQYTDNKYTAAEKTEHL